jgi:hypothetical protein
VARAPPFTICCGFESFQPGFVNVALTGDSGARARKSRRKAAQRHDNFHTNNFATGFESFRWEF